MYCKYCGKQIEPGSVMCPYCGQKADALSGGTGFWDLIDQDLSQDGPQKDVAAPVEQKPPENENPPLPEHNIHPESDKRPKLSKNTAVVAAAVLAVFLIIHSFTYLQLSRIESKLDAFEEQLGAVQNDITRCQSIDNEPADVSATPTPEVTASVQPSPTASVVEVPESTDSTSGNNTYFPAPDLTIDVAFGHSADGDRLELTANVQPGDILESEDQIKWWKGVDGSKQDEPLYEGGIQATGKEQYYAFSSAEGNPARFVYYTIESDDGQEYVSERIYVLHEVVSSIEEENIDGKPYLRPEYMGGFEAYMPGGNYSGHWEYKTPNALEWAKLESNDGYISKTEIDNSYQYRFVVQSGETILGIAYYNEKDE